MCASCVSQGALYLGGSAAALRVMALRARRHRPAVEPEPDELGTDDDIAAVSGR